MTPPQKAEGARGQPRRDRGQATVELALALPFLMMFLLAGVQLLVVVRAQLAVINAAREGARAAAVSPAPGAAATEAARAAVHIAELSVATATSSGRVRVEVRTRVHTDVPLVGALIGDVTVFGITSMAVEP